MSAQDNTSQDPKPNDLGGDLGRKAGRLLKTGGPRIKKLVEDNRPRVEQAGRDAAPRIKKLVEDNRPRVEQAGRDAFRYAQEHEDEIKALAMKGVRMRLGPLGMALDALNKNASAETPQADPVCPACQASNARAARFCSHCGARFEPQS